MSDSGGRSSNDFLRPVRHEQRRPGLVPSAASGGRPQVVSLLNVRPTAGSRSSRPSIATTQSPRAFSHTIPQYAYSNNHHSPYIGHPSFLSLAHVEAMRFPQATHYPPQGAHPPRTYMPYMPLPSRVGVPIPPPLGAASYHYPPPLVPYPYNRTQHFPSFSTPGSPFIPPQYAPEWVPVLFQQRRDFPFPAFQVSSTPSSSTSPVHTQPSESTESLAAPPPAPSAANVPVVDGQRRMFSSAPVPSPPEERSLDVPVRPSSAPAVFPATAPHDARSRPAVPVTQCLDANALRGQPGPDLPNSRTAGRRHKQTQHVLWMGNIPNDATEEELHAFLSQPDSLEPIPPRQADGSEAYVPFCSIFLMPKSNCAFVNYNSKEELFHAVHRFHGRRLRPNMRVRLVCRIRTKEKAEQQLPTEHPALTSGLLSDNLGAPVPTTSGSKRFFVLKSVTHVDLLLSVQHGYWCTRRHNETTINIAFNSVDHVYLIFGVNKSGEFFGYGKMSSAIFDDQGNRVIDPSVTWPPHSFPKSQSGQSQSTSSGQSVSGRTSTNPSPPLDQFQPGSSASSTSSVPVPTYGAPFRVEWIRTIPLPFGQVTHLKNPWNGNHEIKASRDGTELPPDLGQMMLDEWERYVTEVATTATEPSADLP